MRQSTWRNHSASLGYYLDLERPCFRKEILDQLDAIRTELRQSRKPGPASNQWIDNEEASRLLKVSKRTLQTYRDTGEISFSQTGNKIYYRLSDIDDFLQRHHHKAFKLKR